MKNLTGIILSTAIMLAYSASPLWAADTAPPPLPPLPNFSSNDLPSPVTQGSAPNGMKELTLPPVASKNLSGTSSASSVSSSALPPLPTPGQDPFANMTPPAPTKSISGSKSTAATIDPFPVPPLPPTLGGPAETSIKTAPIIVTADDTAKETDKDIKGKAKKKGKKGKNAKTKKVATQVAPRTPSIYFVSEPLPEAIYKKSYDRLNRHLPVAYYESDYDTLMFVTAAHDDVNGLHSLLDNGRNVELIDTAGDTPLLVAVKNSSINAVRLLLAHRANPNVKDRSGMTPLQIATQKGNYPMQRALEEMGATACTQVSSAQ